MASTSSAATSRMYQYSYEVGEVNYASLMDDRAAHALLEAVARSLGATVLQQVQGLLCVTGKLRLEALSPAVFVEYTPCRDKGLFTLDIVREEPVDKRSVEQLVEECFPNRDSGGQKVVSSHLIKSV